MKKGLIVGLMALMTMVAVPAVQADSITYAITSDHISGGGGETSYGSVTLTTIGGGVEVDVLLTNGNSFVLTGAGANQYVLFDLSPTASFTASSISIISPPTYPYTLTGDTPTLPATTFHADGTGDWTFGITSNAGTGGSQTAFSEIKFDVAGASLSSFVSNGTTIFAFDILSGANGLTGLVDAGGTTTTGVPEPSTMLLLGSGLVGLVGFRRKFRK